MWKKISLVFLLLFISGVFLKYTLLQNNKAVVSKVENCDSVKIASFNDHLTAMYNQMALDTANLSFELFRKGMVGYFNLRNKGHVDKPVLSLIDFSKPSTEKRLWVIDLHERNLLFYSLVAHGRNTGENLAQNFSNTHNSNMSSIGFYVTSTQYVGKHGLSLIIDGVEEGFNTNARDRAVVIHGADYVSQEFINNVGRLGRSQGCPALPAAICEDIICTICDKSAMFVYFPDEEYEEKSEYLVEQPAIAEFHADKIDACLPALADASILDKLLSSISF